MMDFYVAKARLHDEIKLAQKIDTVPLVDAVGKTLSSDIFAKYDAPLFDNSAMDGYALCDATGEQLSFKIIGRIAAGELNHGISLKEGEAVRIFTGAPIPENTTTVVIQENVTVKGEDLELKIATGLRKNIRYQGEEIRKSELLVSKNTKITPSIVALCASQGIRALPVYMGLNIAVISTGSELIELDDTLSESKIYDANRYMLRAWLERSHKVTDVGILPDDYEKTCAALKEAATQNDVIILSGGASVGEEDHIKQAILSQGELHGWKLSIKPGKPFGWGKIGNAYVFMLPGNPVSAYVTFYLLVYPLLMQAISPNVTPAVLQGYAKFERQKIEPRREFLRGHYYQDEKGIYALDIVGGQGSAMLSGIATANCLIEIPPSSAISFDTMLAFYPLS